MFLPGGLELGDLGLLDHDLLSCGRVGERAGLRGVGVHSFGVALALIAGWLRFALRAAISASASASFSAASRLLVASAMRAAFFTSAMCGLARLVM